MSAADSKGSSLVPLTAADKISTPIDGKPLLLAPVLALLAFPLVGSTSTWITLTAAVLAMGMIVFIIASGLTLIFGLTDVLNFGHGFFIALGGYFAVSVLAAMPGWMGSESGLVNFGAVVIAMVVAMLVTVVVGLLIFVALVLVLNRTKLGLLIRAGVQDREMVEALGYHIRRLFIGVFVAGSALAGLGGVMWGMYQQNVVPQMGAHVNVLIFIVVIIGGLGSTTGCFLGALLVGLLANYTGFLVPKVALFSNILLMVAILAWRPRGLYPVTGR